MKIPGEKLKNVGPPKGKQAFKKRWKVWREKLSHNGYKILTYTHNMVPVLAWVNGPHDQREVWVLLHNDVD